VLSNLIALNFEKDLQMMNASETIETIDVSIAQAQKQVNKMNSIFNLSKNRDFIEVIEKGYFEEEASRLVLLKADPNLQKPEDQASIIRSIDAIGHFRQFLGTTISIGRMMEKSLSDDVQTKHELMSEDD
jgi:hypothetical protein